MLRVDPRLLHLGDPLTDVIESMPASAFPFLVNARTLNWRESFTGTPNIPLQGDARHDDLFLAVARSSTGSGTWSWPAGWSELLDANTDGSDDAVTAAYHRVTQTESLSRVQPTYSVSPSRFGAVTFQIRNAGTPQASSVTAATTTTPDPPNLTPAGGALDYLWLAVATMEDNRPTTPPTNYTDDGDIVSTQGLVTTGAACTTISWGFRQLNAASENPGAFGTITNSFTMCFTIAMPPL